MAKWDDEDEESTPPSSPPPVAARQHKFDDEEDDSDVLESWDAAEDSEVEREKAKAAAAAKAKAEAEAKANKKSKSQRIEEKRMESMRRRQAAEEQSSEESEDEAEKRQRMRKMEKDADLKNAEDLFGGIGISNNRATATKAVNVADPKDSAQTIDLAQLKLFNPDTLTEFTRLRETVAPLLLSNSKKAHYVGFTQELSKQLVRDMTSDQVKKIASALTALSNEKMREEKAADKGAKKSKAVKTKTTLNASRDVTARADVNAYDDGLDDDDFM